MALQSAEALHQESTAAKQATRGGGAHVQEGAALEQYGLRSLHSSAGPGSVHACRSHSVFADFMAPAGSAACQQGPVSAAPGTFSPWAALTVLLLRTSLFSCCEAQPGLRSLCGVPDATGLSGIDAIFSLASLVMTVDWLATLQLPFAHGFVTSDHTVAEGAHSATLTAALCPSRRCKYWPP